MKIKFADGYIVKIDKKHINHQDLKDAVNAVKMIKAKKNNDIKDAEYVKKPVSNTLLAKSKLPKSVIKTKADKGKINVTAQDLKRYIDMLKIDMDADVKHVTWDKKFANSKELLEMVIKEYEDNINALKEITDPDVIEELQLDVEIPELEEKLEIIRENFGFPKEIKSAEVADIEIKDAKSLRKAIKRGICSRDQVRTFKDVPPPLQEPHYSFNISRDPEYSSTDLETAYRYLTERNVNPNLVQGAEKILEANFNNFKQNLLNDIDNYEDMINEYTKSDLRLFMENYRKDLEAYRVSANQDMYKELKDLFDKLYYNCYGLSAR